MKDPWQAVFLSSIFPGLGQIYSGARAKGCLFAVIQTVSGIALMGCAIAITKGWSPWLAISAGVFGGIFSVYNLFDAYSSAEQLNFVHKLDTASAVKKPFLALFLSLIFPGLGQFYNAQAAKGLGCLALFFVTAAFTQIFDRFAFAGLVISNLVLVLVHLFIMKDAYAGAEKSNGRPASVRARFKPMKICGVITLWVALQLLLSAAPVFIRTYYLMPYRIPAESMKPALQQGDRILADQSIYKNGNPKRGDLVVFYLPKDPHRAYVKRVAGLPGEILKIQDGRIYINGKALESSIFPEKRYYSSREDWQYGKAGMEILIPDEHYFLLGDNTGQSFDSRNYGPIPKRAIRSKVIFIWWPLQRWSRIQD